VAALAPCKHAARQLEVYLVACSPFDTMALPSLQRISRSSQMWCQAAWSAVSSVRSTKPQTLTTASPPIRRLPSDGSFDLPDLRGAASAPSAASDGDGGNAEASTQLPGASDASTWANSRLRPEGSAGGGLNTTMSAAAHSSGDVASCQAGVTALWDNRGRAGLLSSGATGSTTGLQAPLPAPCGVPAAAEPACAGGGCRLSNAPSQQRTDAQRPAGEPGGPLAMLSDTVLAGYCWEYQPQALNADGAPGHLLSLVGVTILQSGRHRITEACLPALNSSCACLPSICPQDGLRGAGFPSAAAPAGMALPHGGRPAAEAASGAQLPGHQAAPGWWQMGAVPLAPLPGQAVAHQAGGFASVGQRPAASGGESSKPPVY